MRENCREPGSMSVSGHNCQCMSAVESAFQIDLPDVESMSESVRGSRTYPARGRALRAMRRSDGDGDRASGGSESTTSADGVGSRVISCRWSRSGGEIVVVLFNSVGGWRRGEARRGAQR